MARMWPAAVGLSIARQGRTAMAEPRQGSAECTPALPAPGLAVDGGRRRCPSGHSDVAVPPASADGAELGGAPANTRVVPTERLGAPR